MKRRIKFNTDYIRNIVFGIEDSLVSTTGFLFGLAASGEYTAKNLILAGIVLISVEAVSMGMGVYLTESEVQSLNTKKNIKDNPVVAALLMFFSYLLSGIISLLPYFFLPPQTGKIISMLLVLESLYLLGYIPTRNVKYGIKMLILAGITIFFGYLVASVFKNV